MHALSLDPPVRPADAGALAEVLFETAHGRRMTDEVRSRIAPRVEALRLPTITPYVGSLQADPVHGDAFLIAVDGAIGDAPEPLLLRFAPATSPASVLFRGSILVGRMRLAASRLEIVVNAMPFGPADDTVFAFAEKVDRAFLPRPVGSASSLSAPAAFAEAAFSDFRQIAKSRGVNLAAFHGDACRVMWCAIRAGWRDGYGLDSDPITLSMDSRPQVAATVAASGRCTKLVLDVSSAKRADRVQLILEALDSGKRSRASGSQLKQFDFELLGASGNGVDCTDLLRELKEAGRVPRSVRIPECDDASELVTAIRQAGAVPNIPASANSFFLRSAVRAAGGRLQCTIPDSTPIREVADRLRAT